MRINGFNVPKWGHYIERSFFDFLPSGCGCREPNLIRARLRPERVHPQRLALRARFEILI